MQRYRDGLVAIERGCACGLLWMVALWWGSAAIAAPIKVVTVLTDHAWMAAQIGGHRVQVQSFLTGKEDPHFASARPSLILMASHADLFVSVGMDLDIGYTPLILRNSRNANIQVGAKGYVDASLYVNKLQVPQIVSRAMGDVHPQGNPHYYLEPIAFLDSGRAILEGLIRVDGAHKAFYIGRFRALQRDFLQRMVGNTLVQAAGVKRLLELLRAYALFSFLQRTRIGGRPLLRYLGGWMKQMLPCRGQKMISYHMQWIYFRRRFGLHSLGQMEPKPGIPPTAKHLEQLIARSHTEKPRWIVAPNYFAASSAQFLAQKTKTKLLILPVHTHGSAQATTYPALIDAIISQFCKDK